ncbi:hypothetical protein ACHAWC_011661 [Mediolabrus comicus]
MVFNSILFACGGTQGGGMKEDIKDSIQEFNTSIRLKGSNLKENIKQRGIDTVEEVKGSFNDFGLTVKQVFSPWTNAKTGSFMVVNKVKTKLGMKTADIDVEDDEYTECTDEDKSYDDDYSESSSLTYTTSNVSLTYTISNVGSTTHFIDEDMEKDVDASALATPIRFHA